MSMRVTMVVITTISDKGGKFLMRGHGEDIEKDSTSNKYETRSSEGVQSHRKKKER